MCELFVYTGVDHINNTFFKLVRTSFNLFITSTFNNNNNSKRLSVCWWYRDDLSGWIIVQSYFNVSCFRTNCKSLWTRASAVAVSMSSVCPPLVKAAVQHHETVFTYCSRCFSEMFSQLHFLCGFLSNVFLNLCRARDQGGSPAVQRGDHGDRDSQVWDRDFRGGHSCHLETEGRDSPPVCCKITKKDALFILNNKKPLGSK